MVTTAKLFIGSNSYQSFAVIFTLSQFTRRLSRIVELVPRLLEIVKAQSKRINVIDSKPIPLCQNIRLPRCKLTKHVPHKEKLRGFIASKRQYFYGVKLHLITNDTGGLLEYSPLPGSIHDMTHLLEINLNLTSSNYLLADKIYNYGGYKAYIDKDTSYPTLEPLRKKNFKQRGEHNEKLGKQIRRRVIETTFSLLENMGIDKLRASSLQGWLSKVHLSIFALRIHQTVTGRWWYSQVGLN